MGLFVKQALWIPVIGFCLIGIWYMVDGDLGPGIGLIVLAAVLTGILIRRGLLSRRDVT